MSTNGLYGYILNDELRLEYNHWDSYPSGLGETIVEGIKGLSKKDLEKRAESLRNTASHWLLNKICSPIEYAYIINLDWDLFEVYEYGEGKQRYKWFDLFNIPEDWKEQFINTPCSIAHIREIDNSFLLHLALSLATQYKFYKTEVVMDIYNKIKTELNIEFPTRNIALVSKFLEKFRTSLEEKGVSL